jgi:hypothetical protein
VELDRQPVPGQHAADRRPLPPQRIPETHPTPLQDWFIYLSVVVLVCGVIAISALELGAPLSDPIVRWPLVIGGVLLVAVTADALVRVWRSAWAWLPVDRGRGLFRFVWSAVLGGVLVAAAATVGLALLA